MLISIIQQSILVTGGLVNIVWNCKKLMIVGAFLLTAPFPIYAAAAVNKCQILFAEDVFTKRDMSTKEAQLVAQAVESIKNSTTGARKEDKWTVLTTFIEKKIRDLATSLAHFQISIEARDKQTPGKKNVTDTVYLSRFSIKASEFVKFGFKIADKYKNNEISKFTFKIRIRKYGVIDNKKSIDFTNIEYASFTQNHSFVEFKFANPEHEGAVFKPRIYMSDAHIQLLGTPDFLTQFEQIKAETLNLAPNKDSQQSAIAMLDFFKEAQNNQYSFKPLMRNLYERTSYAINFTQTNPIQSVAPKKFQIQMTVDNSITSVVYGDSDAQPQSLNAYAPEHSVVEIKTPVEFVGIQLPHNPFQSTVDSQNFFSLQQIPGYETFLNFVEDLSENHDPKYEEGKGKAFHGHRQYKLAP